MFRFSLGVPRPLFLERFGPPPPRPGKGRAVEGPWDFTELDRITPHPVYGWGCRVGVLNSIRAAMAQMDAMIAAGFDKARRAFERRIAGC